MYLLWSVYGQMKNLILADGKMNLKFHLRDSKHIEIQSKLPKEMDI